MVLILPKENDMLSKLMERVQMGDMDAFNELVEGVRKKVTYQRMGRGLSSEDAEEQAQEVFLRIYRYRGRYVNEHEDDRGILGWITRITDNVATTFNGRKQRRPETMPLDESLDRPDERPDPEAAWQNLHLSEEMQRAFHELPPEFRAVLVYADVHGMTYKEAAQALGIPVGTVRSRLNRGRRHIRDSLERQKRESMEHQRREGPGR